jgi:hypothetical protein
MTFRRGSSARGLTRIVFILVVLLPIAVSRADNLNRSVDDPNNTSAPTWNGAGWGFWSTSSVIGAGTDLSALGLPGLGYEITCKVRTNYNGGWDVGAHQH